MAIQITMRQLLAASPCTRAGDKHVGFKACSMARPGLDLDTPCDVLGGYAHSSHSEVVWTLQCLPPEQYQMFVEYCCWCARRVLLPDSPLHEVLDKVLAKDDSKGASDIVLSAPRSLETQIARVLLGAYEGYPLHLLVGSVEGLCLRVVRNRQGRDAAHAEKAALLVRFKQLLSEGVWAE